MNLLVLLSRAVRAYLITVDGGADRQLAVRIEVVPLAVDLYPLVGNPETVLVKPILAALRGGQPAGDRLVIVPDVVIAVHARNGIGQSYFRLFRRAKTVNKLIVQPCANKIAAYATCRLGEIINTPSVSATAITSDSILLEPVFKNVLIACEDGK